MSSEFKCENCTKTLPMDEKAQLSSTARLLFLVANVIVGGGLTWSMDVCRKCVNQRYIWSFLVLTGLLTVGVFLL
jgi:hypothetical protein